MARLLIQLKPASPLYKVEKQDLWLKIKKKPLLSSCSGCYFQHQDCDDVRVVLKSLNEGTRQWHSMLPRAPLCRTGGRVMFEQVDPMHAALLEAEALDCKPKPYNCKV